MDFDEILPLVGEFGKYQKLMIILVILPGTIPCGFNAYNQLFMASAVEHWCKIPGAENASTEQKDYLKNISIPLQFVNGKYQYSKCFMRDLNYTNLISRGIDSFEYNNSLEFAPIIPCNNGWDYFIEKGRTSIISEWDLVCDKEIYPTISLVLFGAGGLVGNFIFGYIQDGLGRKPAFFIYLAITCIFGVATSFANNFTTWVIFRIGVGFTIPAVMTTPMVLALELVGSRHRTLVNILSNIMYSFSLIGLSAVVYFIRDWRILSLSTSIPFIFYFIFWFLMPESPRWLLSQGRIEEMNKIFISMARTNRRSISQLNSEITLLQSLNKTACKYTEEKSYGVLDLVRTPNLRMKTIIITFIWFASTSVYVGLSYYAPSLGGDEYLNFFLAGAVELPTYLFLWPAMEKWGRRWILCLSMIIGGTACLATFLTVNDSVITLGLYCVGKMGISSSFVVILLMTSELYPTVIRGLGIGMCSVFGGLGPIFIPLINYLGTDSLTLPLVIMGGLLIFGGSCSLLLPETLHKNLPQTLQDGERTGLRYCTCGNAK